MVNKKPLRVWVVLAEEETPLCLVKAKTAGGAMKQFELHTGRSREEIHVELVEFYEGYFPFTLNS